MLSKKSIAIGLTVLSLFGGVVAGCGSSSKSSSSATQQKQKTYVEADINVLISDVEENAMKASKNYKGKDVKIVNGYVSNIESGGSYICVDNGAAFTLKQIQAYPKTKQAKEAFVNLSKGQRVVIYGTIKDVGEIMGYSLDLDKVEGK